MLTMREGHPVIAEQRPADKTADHPKTAPAQ